MNKNVVIIVPKEIVLASSSPWRKRLLKKHGVLARIHVSNFDEKKTGNPRALVIHNACGKAQSVAKHYKNAIIIGVDTIGVYGKLILGKPTDRAHAKSMIQTLSGKRHRVISGICLIDTSTGKKVSGSAVSYVTFKKLGKEELEKYLDSGHWKGKAGSYAIQGRAKGFVERVEGEISNVVGLPIEYFKKMLERLQH